MLSFSRACATALVVKHSIEGWDYLMYRMFYLSKIRDGLGQADLDSILQTARQNNKRLGITGLLVAKGKFFTQALEGEKYAVLDLFERIERDDRHQGVVIISSKDVEDRIFPGWDMGFRDLAVGAPNVRLPDVSLDDPRFVSEPEQLSIIFRSIIEEDLNKGVLPTSQASPTSPLV